MENKDISDQVIQYVMTVPDEEFAELSVSVLANSFEVDRFKLLRQFKCQTGMTLEYFLFKEKMNRASFLLKTCRNLTVKEIAVRIGFCSCDYFIRTFRNYFGIVPRRLSGNREQRQNKVKTKNEK